MKRFITVTQGMSGHFAVMMWWNDEDKKCQFWEPYDTGFGRYENVENAINEAKDWALDEQCRYIAPGERFENDR